MVESCQPEMSSERTVQRPLGRALWRRPRPFLATAVIVLGFCASGESSAGWHLSEAYTADAQGLPVALHSRLFSLGVMPEICDKSPVPSKFVPRDPIRLRVGQHIERIGQVSENRQDEIVVDAYDENGSFLPHVPIRVTVTDPQGIIGYRSDGDYVEAVAPGEASFDVTWACESDRESRVQSRIRVLVTA